MSLSEIITINLKGNSGGNNNNDDMNKSNNKILPSGYYTINVKLYSNITTIFGFGSNSDGGHDHNTGDGGNNGQHILSSGATEGNRLIGWDVVRVMRVVRK